MIANATNVTNGTFVNQCNDLINLAKANAAVKFRVLGYKREPKYLDKFNNKNKRSIQTATDRLIKHLVDAMNTLKHCGMYARILTQCGCGNGGLHNNHC